MAATAEEKFNAAVKVIRGLPKNGSFQPSHEMMLKFYAYYKQATEGPCTAPKPGIWNLVNRKKWEAWAELGDMPREEAMLHYVDELKNVSKHVKETLYPPEIVETMPQTEQVADFVQTLGTFYELVEEGQGAELMKSTRRMNGSPAFNGGGDDDDSSFNHSATIGEMLRINNNDLKNGAEDPDALDGNERGFNGVLRNGQREEGQEEDEEEEEKEEEEEEAESRKSGEAPDVSRVDSGSDTDEFCDTSDQLIQVPIKVKPLNAASAQAQQNTSTPVDMRREARVRFAPDSHLAQERFLSGSDNYSNPENGSPQLRNERLGLGSPTGFSFLPQTTDFPPRQMSESLYVNDSCSSLASLAGDASNAGDFSYAGDPSVISDFAEDNYENDSIVDGEGLTFMGRSDLVTSRGGGEEEGASMQGSGRSYPGGGFSGGGSYAGSGRDSNRSAAGSSRRGLFPSGSGGGGQRRGGDGRDPGRGSGLEDQMLVTLLRLQQDMVNVATRLAKLEADVQRQGLDQEKRVARKKNGDSWWWPFNGMSKKMAFFVIVWPLIVPFIINLLCRRRRTQR